MVHEDVLRRVFGLDRLRPMQEPVVDAMLAGQDVLAIMPTGGGKSLCYQLPALIGDGVTVVISPLIALMRDQVRALNTASVSSSVLPDVSAPASTPAARSART